MFKPLAYDLNEVLRLFKERRVLELRGLSNRLIREAAIENDYGKAELGVISYALHKIESKSHFVDSPKWHKVKELISKDINSAIFASQKNDQVYLLECLKKIIKGIEGIDNVLGNFAMGVYEKAKVKQASLAYSYGLSISQSADLTGADKKEVQSYIGFTTMHDEEIEVLSIKKRVDNLRELVKGNTN